MDKVEVYEVGWAYEYEYPTAEEKIAALTELLDSTSRDPDDWILIPEIRYQNIEVLSEFSKPGSLYVTTRSAWAVYGQMKIDLGVNRIIEGQRMPVRERG